MNFLAAAAVLVAVGAGYFIANAPPAKTKVGGYVTSLDGRTPNQSHNARLALSKLVNVEVQPGETLSFNKTVGTWTRDQGYRRAPVSYNGTLIDAWGGGVCQTSTTLYNAGLSAGLIVEERHPHRFSPSYAPPGRDAAVAFNNIDLRLRNPYDFPLRVRGVVEGHDLRIWFEAEGRHAQSVNRAIVITDVNSHGAPKSIEVRRPNSGPDRAAYIRNAGKAGWEVTTFRLRNNRKELVSVDSYPAMDRVVEFR